MAIALAAAFPSSSTSVRAQFSEAFNQDSQLYEKSNYQFSVRYGTNILIYAKEVIVIDNVTIDIILSDDMLEDGHYRLLVNGVSAISDSIQIQNGAGPNTAVFDGSGASSKCFSIRRKIPQWLNTKPGTNFNALLCGTGVVLDDAVGDKPTSQINQLIDAICLRLATGVDLDAIANNYGVERPEFLVGNDSLYRQVIPLYGTKRKAVIGIFYELLRLALGNENDSGWGIYEVTPNVLNIDIPASLAFGLAPGSLASATYFHADASITSPPSYAGDYFLADATVAGSTIGGNTILIFQQFSITDLLEDLKAAGIELEITIIG